MINLLKGIALGAGAILPGISSGVLCVVFGIYEKLINSILNFFTDIKKNIKFLFPIFSGCFIGMILFGNILNYLFTNFRNLSCFCFIGLIIGSIPNIIVETFSKFNDKSENKISLNNILALLLTLSLSIFLIVLESSNSLAFIQSQNTSSIELIFTGILMSAGIVVPGVSSTVILMLLGKYELYLSSIANLNIPILFPLGIGVLLGSLLLMILISFMFKYFYKTSYFAIIGFVIGAIPILFPSNVSIYDLILGIPLMVFCFFLINRTPNSKTIKA